MARIPVEKLKEIHISPENEGYPMECEEYKIGTYYAKDGKEPAGVIFEFTHSCDGKAYLFGMDIETFTDFVSDLSDLVGKGIAPLHGKRKGGN